MSALSELYEAAIQRSTKPNTLTDRPDERDDVAAATAADRASCERWLHTAKFLVPGQDDQVWAAIKRNWIGFLSATSTVPDATLAPNRKVVQFFTGDESQAERKSRFQIDRRQRIIIQASFWMELDGKEALTQRWPPRARSALNAEDVGTKQDTFQTLIPDQHEAKRRRYQAVWASFISFLVYSHDEGTLEEMGLMLDEDQIDDIIDVSQAASMVTEGIREFRNEGVLSGVWSAIQQLVVNALRKTASTPHNNPLTWWMAILVRSAVGGERDFISHGRFDRNPLPMDIDIRARISSLVHYSKIIIVNESFLSWEVRNTWIAEIQKDLDSVDQSWICAGSGLEPPLDTNDKRVCESAAWQAMLDHLRNDVRQNLGGERGTAMHWVRLLERAMDV